MRHKFFGHLFSGRYKALIVEGSGTGYPKTVCDYVHLNPVRAHLLEPHEPLETYHWSSYRWYIGPVGARPAWLRVDRLLGEWGIGCECPEAGARGLPRQWKRGEKVNWNRSSCQWSEAGAWAPSHFGRRFEMQVGVYPTAFSGRPH